MADFPSDFEQEQPRCDCGRPLPETPRVLLRSVPNGYFDPWTDEWVQLGPDDAEEVYLWTCPCGRSHDSPPNWE